MDSDSIKNRRLKIFILVLLAIVLIALLIWGPRLLFRIGMLFFPPPAFSSL